ncbi:Smr/MutS family protein [bacterium]|nr:Smr/MutS family protein [bacterium]
MMKTLDIGHRNLFLDEAMTVLETEVSEAMFSGNVQAVKIIHGHGSGALRRAVREWCKTQHGRFKKIIYGEDYDLFHPDSIAMRSECGLPYDPDFGKRNRAITYIWFL